MSELQKYEVVSCDCGAITVTNDKGHQVSMPKTEFDEKFLPYVPPASLDLDFDKNWNCNHCINHWGTDVCACGSGKPFKECDGGFNECGKPYYDIDYIFH